MYTLEHIPDELSLQILGHLSLQDLKSCRLVSFLLRQKIDRLFHHNFNCIYLDDLNLPQFRVSRRVSFRKSFFSCSLPLPSNFTCMKICPITQFTYHSGKLELSPCTLKSHYFETLVELEFTHAIGRKYFLRFLELSKSLQILKLSSAVLGGTENLFGLHSESKGKSKLGLFKWSFLRDKLIKPLVNPYCLPRSLMNLLELHLKLDYISPSTPHFSPFVLVDNLNTIRQLPTFFLTKYSVSIEESKTAEQFYFTITALLNTIPVRCYECLKILTFVAPKCRQENAGRYETDLTKKEKMVKAMTKYSEMKLLKLQFKIETEYRHEMPPELWGLVSSQKYLEKLDLTGVVKSI